MPPPSPPVPTIAQRAPRWIGFLGIGAYLCLLVLNGFDSIGDGYAGYLFIAGLYCFVLLIALPDTLPMRLKALFCVGGMLAGMIITWILVQAGNGLAKHLAAAMAPCLVGVAARMLAGLWVRTPPAQADAGAKSG